MPHTVIIITIPTHQLYVATRRKFVHGYCTVAFSPVSGRLNIRLKQKQPEEFILYCIDTCPLVLASILCAQRCIASIKLKAEWERYKGKRAPTSSFIKSILHFISNLSSSRPRRYHQA